MKYVSLILILLAMQARGYAKDDAVLIRVFVHGKAGFIDLQGKVVIEPTFKEAGTFNNGLAAVYIDGRYGYIDETGKVVIAPHFEYANDFVDGYAIVYSQGTANIIDRNGRVTITP